MSASAAVYGNTNSCFTTYDPLQGDQIGDFLPIGLFLDALCDFSKGCGSPKKC
jgi:hypothetical protein